MELRHIRYFIAVADSLNFRKASERLRIAQPPLSRQIRQLESELGVELFIRNQRHVSLTKSGQIFLEEARKLMIQAGHAIEAVRQSRLDASNLVKIGVASGLGGAVHQVVSGCSEHWPDLEIECHDIFSNLQSQALRRREIDIGFLRPPFDQAILDCKLLYEEEFLVVMPRSHRLAKRKSVRIREIADESLLIVDRNISSGLYDKILSLYSRHGLTPRLFPRHVEAHEEAVAITVASGKAIYIDTGAIANRTVSGIPLALLRLNEPEAKIEIYVAWRKNEDSPAVRRFVEYVRSTPPMR
jgi:DNA-binding transcriptional LysR family regulator